MYRFSRIKPFIHSSQKAHTIHSWRKQDIRLQRSRAYFGIRADVHTMLLCHATDFITSGLCIFVISVSSVAVLHFVITGWVDQYLMFQIQNLINQKSPNWHYGRPKRFGNGQNLPNCEMKGGTFDPKPRKGGPQKGLSTMKPWNPANHTTLVWSMLLQVSAFQARVAPWACEVVNDKTQNHSVSMKCFHLEPHPFQPTTFSQSCSAYGCLWPVVQIKER